jgi:hypothetical protein
LSREWDKFSPSGIGRRSDFYLNARRAGLHEGVRRRVFGTSLALVGTTTLAVRERIYLRGLFLNFPRLWEERRAGDGGVNTHGLRGLWRRINDDDGGLRGGRCRPYWFSQLGREYFDEVIVWFVIEIPHFLLLEILAARNDLAIVVSALPSVLGLDLPIREVVVVSGT